jgi:hypothetical protein
LASIEITRFWIFVGRVWKICNVWLSKILEVEVLIIGTPRGTFFTFAKVTPEASPTRNPPPEAVTAIFSWA